MPLKPTNRAKAFGKWATARSASFIPTMRLVRRNLKTVALYRKTLANYFPAEKQGFVSLEGFVDGMVLVEGLKRAGKDLNREGLILGIEFMTTTWDWELN